MAFQVRVILIFICIIERKTEASIILAPEDYIDESLMTFIDCMKNFKTVFDKSVMLSHEVQTNYFADKFMKAMDISVSLVNIDSRQPKGTNYRYIVFSPEISFYERLIKGISTESKTTFTIIWPWSNVTVPITTLEEIFSIFWRRQMFSLLVMVEDKNHDINIYYHFPYSPNQCGRVGPPTLVDTWNARNKDFNNGFFTKFTNLLRNFHHCPLKVLSKNRPPESSALKVNSSLLLGGIGGKILTALMRKFNFSVTITQAEDLESDAYLRDKYGYALSNYSKDKIVQGLSGAKFDLAFGVFPFVSYFSPDFELSFFYFTENFAFYVPCGTKETPSLWRFYYVEFSLPIWVTVLLLFLVFLCFMKLLSTVLAKEGSSFSSFCGNTFILWAIHVENTASFRTRSTTAKAFFTMVMFYSMIISVAYRASLKSFLMAHLEPKSIETWEELEESDFQIAGLSQDLHILNTIGTTYVTLQKLAQKYEVRSTGEFSDIVYDLAVKRNTAFFGSERMLMYYYFNLQEEYGTTIQRVCQVGQFVSSSPASLFLMRSGSPFRYMIDQLTINDIQTGHMTFTGRAAATKTSTAYSLNEKQETFSLNHLRGTFLMWFIGITLALIALTIEVMYYKLHPDRTIFL